MNQFAREHLRDLALQSSGLTRKGLLRLAALPDPNAFVAVASILAVAMAAAFVVGLVL